MKKKIGELAFQIIPVMIGVYLGFLLSDWSQSKMKEQQSELLIENLLVEIETNKGILKNVIDYHVMLRDSSTYYSNPNVKIGKRGFFRGTSIIKLTNGAFNTGVQTGIINEFSIDKIQAINQLYTLQDDYNEFADIMMASLINKEFSENEEDLRKIVRFLSVTMTDVVLKEEYLINEYEAIYTLLKK